MPIDRGIVDRQLQAIGEGPSWWEQRELRDLPSILQADENIVAISRGRVARIRWLRRTWLIVVTDRRLVCLRSARSAGWRQFEVAGSLITRVALRVGPFNGRVIIAAAGHTYRLLTPRSDAIRIFNALSAMAPQGRPEAPGFRPTLIARRVIDHVLALPAVALNEPPTPPPPPPQPDPAVDEHVRRLEDQLEEMRQQVEFLEQLVQQQQLLERRG